MTRTMEKRSGLLFYLSPRNTPCHFLLSPTLRGISYRPVLGQAVVCLSDNTKEAALCERVPMRGSRSWCPSVTVEVSRHTISTPRPFSRPSDIPAPGFGEISQFHRNSRLIPTPSLQRQTRMKNCATNVAKEGHEA